MKLLYTTTLLLFTFLLSAQYNYGLEVEQQDAKIEGKLNIQDGTDNIFIGENTGISNINGMRNTILGIGAGANSDLGNVNTLMGFNAGQNVNTFGNTIIGAEAGTSLNSGWNNTLLGYVSGVSLTSGVGNVMIGRFSGNNSNGNWNIFIGYDSGFYETGSDRLYIDSARFNDPDNQTPLIYGEFDNDLLRVNGTLHISETAKLTPMSQPSACNTPNEVGLLYFDGIADKLKVCTFNSGWQDLN